MLRVRFQHLICNVCGLAWKEATERAGVPRAVSRCPRCGITCTQQDVVKVSEESYP